MRRFVLVVIAAWLGGCAGASGEPTGETSAPLQAGSAPDELRIVAQRGGDRLLRGSPSVGAPQTDERPTYRMVVESDGETVEPAGPVLGGALVDGGAVWVTPGHELVDAEGAVLDRGVLPELAVSADGRVVAYPHAAGAGAGVYVVAREARGWSLPRRVTDRLAFADRPLFLADGRLVVVGAVSSGIAGVWVVDPQGVAQPVPVTNGALRTGRPLGPTFVPPPAYHASMRVEEGELVYDDGRGERRVELPAAGSQTGGAR